MAGGGKTIWTPELIAKRSATLRAKNAIWRAAHRAESKTCVRCERIFHPPARKVDLKAWGKRQFCGRSCAARGVMERPEVQKRQKAGTLNRFNDPEYRARHAAAARLNALKATSPEGRRKSGETRTRKALGWIPQEFQQSYVRIRERFGAAHAKQIIRDHMAIAGRRAVAAARDQMIAKQAREQAQAY